jgi:predicted RNA-binding Zn-ribbon protein involved in translation (DUF1610 family)
VKVQIDHEPLVCPSCGNEVILVSLLNDRERIVTEVCESCGVIFEIATGRILYGESLPEPSQDPAKTGDASNPEPTAKRTLDDAQA